MRLRRLFWLSAATSAVSLLSFAAPASAQDDPFVAPARAPEITSAPPSPANGLAPRWSFSASDVAAGFECSLTRDDLPVGDWTACASPVAYDLSGQPDGTYRFAVRALGPDLAAGEIATADYTLDTASVPALPTIVALPGPVAADRSPEWRFTGGADDRFECRLDGGDDTAAEWEPCSSPHEFDLTGEGDGAFDFAVRGLSESGRRGPSRTDEYLLDTVAPATPRVTSAPPEIANDPSPGLGFSTEAGAQAKCRVTGPDGLEQPWTPCMSPHDFDVAADGAYSLAVRSTDAAGNTSPPAVTSYILDTTAPPAPAANAPSVTPATRLQPSFAFAAVDETAYECRLDGPGGYATGWQPCVSPAPYDLTGQPDGVYTFAARGTDAAGNTGEAATASYELARDPDVVDLRSGPGRVGRTRSPRWSFSVDGGSGFVCSLALGSSVVFKPATCGSPRTYSLSGRPDGVYAFTVRASGSTREAAVQEYKLDTAAPPRPEVTAAPVSPAPDNTPRWAFEGEDGASLDCRITRGKATVADWTPCNNPKRFELGATDGNYQVTVRARDAAGNVGPTATSSYKRDATSPAAPTLKAAPASEDIDRSPTWTFAGESGARFTCTLSRGTGVVVEKASCAGEKTYNLSSAQAGAYTFSVEATDAAGNTGPVRTSKYVLAAAPVRATGAGGDAPGPSAVDPGAATGAPGDGGGAGSLPPVQPGTGLPTSDANGPQRRNGTRREQLRVGTASGVDSPEAGSAAATTADAPGAGSGAGNAASREAGARSSRRGDESGFGDAVRDGVRDAARALTGDTAKKVFPLSLLILLGLFLLVQNRIDRREPKIALAPIDGDAALEFKQPPTRR